MNFSKNIIFFRATDVTYKSLNRPVSWALFVTVAKKFVNFTHWIYVAEPCETLCALFYYGPKVLVYGDNDCISVMSHESIFLRRMLPTSRSIAHFLELYLSLLQ
jgi:hypothetical protein